MCPSPKMGLVLAAVLIAVASASMNIGGRDKHYEPMVAMLCPDKRQGPVKSFQSKGAVKSFQNKFLSNTGKWETDYGLKATCKIGKINILEYCKQVYPDKKIVNTIESSKYEKIESWCKSGNLKCRGAARWVKPYRCIESAPKSAAKEGKEKESSLEDEEYYYDDNLLDEEDDEDYFDDDDYEDDEYDDDDEEDYYDDEDDLLNEIDIDGKVKNKKTDKQKDRAALDKLSIDPYYTHYSPSEEHGEFTQALERAEEKHRVKMTQVMKEWTNIEKKYENLAKSDLHNAEKLKQEMSEQFEKRIKNFEDENQGEKDQLIAMHQQRVVSRINQVKEDAMKCYTNSLNDHPVSYPTVRECLEKLLRSLHKDRHHTLAHYKTMVETSPAQADQQKEVTLLHLADIDRILNESLSLLDRFPDLRVKLLPLMEDYLIELRSSDDTPAPLFSMDRVHEEKILDGFKTNIQNRIMKQEEKRREEKRLRKEKYQKMMQEKAKMMLRRKRIDLPSLPQDVIEFTQERVLQSNAQAHTLNQQQPGYSVSEAGEELGSRLGYFCFLGIAAGLVVLLVGIVFRRRKQMQIHSHEGFLEVPTYSSPEEKHLSTMQRSGYENPTYKYFEATVA